MPEAVRQAVGTAVLLPGTGSDEVFVRTVFTEPLTRAGVRLHTPAPVQGTRLAEHYLAELDRAAELAGPILVGGISLGAHLAAEWATHNPDLCAGLLLALPGWHGQPGNAPAALSALASASAVETLGLTSALAAAVAGTPPWLATELDRAWQRAGDELAVSLRVAAGRPGPSLAELAGLAVPAGIAGCVDDAIHPIEVARQWADALPTAELRTLTFAEFGADRAALGRAALAAMAAVIRNRDADQYDRDSAGQGHRR